MLKQCIECEQEKPLTEFYKTRSQCKECIKNKKRAEYKAEPESFRQSAKVDYDNSVKAAIRRAKKFMKRYEDGNDNQ